MAVYFIANDNVTNPDLMQEYFAAVTPLLAACDHEVIGYDSDAFPLERQPARHDRRDDRTPTPSRTRCRTGIP